MERLLQGDAEPGGIPEKAKFTVGDTMERLLQGGMQNEPVVNSCKKEKQRLRLSRLSN